CRSRQRIGRGERRTKIDVYERQPEEPPPTGPLPPFPSGELPPERCLRQFRRSSRCFFGDDLPPAPDGRQDPEPRAAKKARRPDRIADQVRPRAVVEWRPTQRHGHERKHVSRQRDHIDADRTAIKIALALVAGRLPARPPPKRSPGEATEH